MAAAPMGSMPDAADKLRFNQVFSIATHNSYWVKRENLWEFAASGTQERLIDQLLFDHARGLELDLHRDVAHRGVFSIYHTTENSNTLCSPLEECLRELALFHYALPEHEPVTVVLELKELMESNFDATHTPADIDATLERALGAALYRPRDFLARCVPGASMRDCAKTASWPTVAELRGKFLFTVLGNWRASATVEACRALNLRSCSVEVVGGHGPAGWVEYATWGEGAATRSAFPMESAWIRFNQGPLSESIEEKLVTRAQEASLFVQVEHINDPRVPRFLADNLVLRSRSSSSVSDQERLVRVGIQLVQSDYPWQQTRDHSVAQPLRSFDTTQEVVESGHRLALITGGHDAGRVFLHQRVAASHAVWETLPSTTRPSPSALHRNPHAARGRGCLRVATSAAAFDDATDSVTLCRQTVGGSWFETKPVAEDAAITIETVRGGIHTLQMVYSSAAGSRGPGDYLRLGVDSAKESSCVVASSAGGADDKGPLWVELTRACFPHRFEYQGLVADSGEVLFVGTRRTLGSDDDWQYVSGRDLGPPIPLSCGTSVYRVADLTVP